MMLSSSAYWELPKPRKYRLDPGPGFKASLSTLLIMNRPLSLLTPAMSHPEVIVQAVAARQRARAEEFAVKHGIPHVKDSYQG